MRIIDIEGIDGSGKSTLAPLLAEQVRGSHLSAEPFTDYVTNIIASQGWKDPLVLAYLFAADRSIHLSSLPPAPVYIFDRYIFSSVAYQGALGMDMNRILHINAFFPLPTVTILIDVPVEVAMERLRGKRDRFDFEEKRRSLNKVREGYLLLADKFNFCVVDGRDAIDNVLERALSCLRERGILGKAP